MTHVDARGYRVFVKQVPLWQYSRHERHSERSVRIGRKYPPKLLIDNQDWGSRNPLP